MVGVVLACGSMFGLWLAGRNPRAGWLWCLFMEIPWLIYAFNIGEMGLAFLCGAYFFVYLATGLDAAPTGATEPATV